MPGKSKIEWCTDTWNPVTGCTKVSAGCKHCYAETFAERWRGIKGHAYENGFDLTLRPERLRQPLMWKKPRMIFVNSMSDLFHEDIPSEYIRQVFDVMAKAHWHTFQILTKRSERLQRAASLLTWAPNIWMGVSVENQKFADIRIRHLQSVPAAIRFLSVEPLLEYIWIKPYLDGINWVIVGGESGPGARPMDAEWVRSIRDQCPASGTKFFFKQWGGARKKETGRMLDGQTWDDMPEPIQQQPELF